MSIQLKIEAILFAAENPVSIADFIHLFKEINEDIPEVELISHLEAIKTKYLSKDFPFELAHLGGGYQFLSKSIYHEWIARYLHQDARKKLSSAAMETLSIIAYKEPVTKAEIEQIRGVNADYTVHKLLEKELIRILGKADAPGKPILYGVSDYFLDYFGINSTKELPQINDVIPQEQNTIGDAD